MGPVSIGVEVQRNTDGDTPSIFSHGWRKSNCCHRKRTKTLAIITWLLNSNKTIGHKTNIKQNAMALLDIATFSHIRAFRIKVTFRFLAIKCLAFKQMHNV